MKVAVIVPSRDLKKFEGYGDICMSLSHIILEDEKYTQYYREQTEKKDRFVLLDNSAFELEKKTGKGLSVDLVLEAAEKTAPSEVICTDILFEGEATVESTTIFISEVKKRYGSIPYQLMAVPQGKTYGEWRACFRELVRIPEITTIGLSKLGVPNSLLGEFKSSGNAARSRIMLMGKLYNDCSEELVHMRDTGKQFHCLGSDNWGGYEVQKHAKFNRKHNYEFIRSIDSSNMWMYGLNGERLNDEGKIENIIMGKPPLEDGSYTDGDVVDQTSFSLEVLEREVNILHNIAVMLKMSK